MDDYTEKLDVEVNIPDSQPFEEEEELEEKETQSESSPDEQPDETETTEEVVEEVVDNAEPIKPEPKPVEGETPKERALRKEVERLRKEKRDSMKEQLFVPKEEPIKQDVSLEEFDPAEVEKLDKILAARGYVKKDQIAAQTYNEVRDSELDTFLTLHPEYSADNDKDNLLWNQFLEELAIYAKPANPKQYKVLFERVHKNIVGDTVVDRDVTAAASEKLKVASHGSATVNKPKPQPKPSSIDPELKRYMKGFSDEELAEM